MSLLLPLLLALGSQAVEVSLSGRVLDSSGAPIPGATVLVICGPSRLEGVTGDSGEFTIGGVPRERCLAVASTDGFVAVRQSVDLSRPGPARAEFTLAVRPFAAEVVVTPGLGRQEDTSQLPQAASLVERADLEARPYTIVTQALREEVGVLSQQTTSSNGSPILRGFTGQRNGYLLDGVRFNTSAWRDGPSQYLAWIPGFSTERVEIVRGPGSAQYGSDSLGGTISFFAATPQFTDAAAVAGEATLTLAAANALRGGDVSLSMSRARVAATFQASVSEAGDLRTGDRIDSHAAVIRYLGLRSSSVSDDLENTGYTQSSARGAVSWHAAGGIVSASFLHAQQEGARRYDQEMGGNGRYLFEFAPQALDFGYVRYSRTRAGWFDDLSATLSVNRQDDGRIEQARPSQRRDEQSNTTTAIGYQVRGSRSLGARAQASMGAELFDEYISGVRSITEPAGARRQARPDIPDGTRYTSAAVYWQQSLELVRNRLTASGGLRFGSYRWNSKADPAFGVTSDENTSSDLTFNAGTVLAISPNLNVTFSVSRGFRAANAFDFASIGLNGGAGFEITPDRAMELRALRGSTDGATAVSTGEPVGELGPEELYAYEAGVRWHSDTLGASVTVFDLEGHDAIERRTLIFPSNIVGTDIGGYPVVRQDPDGRAYVQGEARPMVSRVNVSRTRIRGFEAEGMARITGALRTRAWASMADGKDLDSGAFLRRMPPVMGGAVLTWQRETSRLWIEGALTFARAQTRLNDGDLGDARIGARRNAAAIASFFNGTATDRGLVRNGILVATGETLAQVTARVLPAGGNVPMFAQTPGFAVVGLRVGVPLGSRLDLIVIGENLADTNYRLHGSGVDEPGINLQARLKVRF